MRYVNISLKEFSNLEEIKNEQFNGCSCLTGMELPENLKKITAYAFHGTHLNSIILPDSVNRIYQNAFSDKTIYYPGTEEEWNSISKDTDWNEGCPSDMKIIFDYTD